MRYNSGTHEFGYHRLQDVFIKIIMNRHRTINLILVILFLLVYAASFQDKTTAQSDTIPSITINSGESIGQTFTSLHRGLNEITITLSSDNPVSGTLRFDLYQNEPDMLALSKEYSVSVSTPKVFILNFEPQTDSYLNDYFLNINWIGSGPVNFQTDVAEGYDQGSLYVNSSPVLAQLSFSLSYDSPQLTLGLALVMCKWFWQLFLTLLILLLPGWAVMTYCWSDWKEYNLFLRLALAFGFSYAIYPILFLLTDLINLHPGELFFVWAVVGVSFLSLLYYYWSDNRNRKPSVKRMINHLRENSDNWLSASFLLVLIIIFLVKCWAIRTLDTPMWGDSYQHTMITQLMINNNGLFDSWQPYVPYNSLTVHFGFHALSAVFAWISGLNASQSILWIGQISNMLAALSLYPITFKISGNNKWAGMIAVIIAALVLKYPNYYVNWGRYAQLSGQVLLPLVGFLLIEALFSNKTNIKNLTIVSVFLGGMALCYYRMPFFLIIWIPILVGEALVWFRKKENRFLQLVIRGAFILLGMLVLLVPVFFRISGGKLAESVGPIQSPSVNNAVSLFIRNLRSTQEYYAQSLIIWAVMSVMIALLIKQWRVLAVALGFVLLHAYNIGILINLPFSNFIDNFSIQIMTYIGLSVTIAYLFAVIFEKLEQLHPWIPLVLILSISLFFAFSAKNVTDKKHEMVTRPDLRAINWIIDNTDQDALFLVNGFTIYDNTSGVGSDAGWWLSLLTDRENTMPPQYAVLNEEPESPYYTDWTVEVINLFESHSPDTDEGKAAMCSWGIDYIYIGQKQGGVNDTTPLLNWWKWENVPYLSLVYAEDLVRIYQFDISFCDESR